MSATATAPTPAIGPTPAAGIDPNRRAPPPPIRHPLFAGNVCLFYPQGTKAPGEARIAFMLGRNNHEHVDLQFLNGDVKSAVRHVDDPFFRGRSQRLADGAWDYAEGTTYDFLVPSRLKFTDQVVDRVLKMHAEGKQPIEISTTIATRGLTVEAVNCLLADYH